MKILEGVTLPPAELARRKRDSSHWVKLANTLYKCEDLQELLVMLYVELHGLKRYYVFQRIYARFNAVRARQEKKELTLLARSLNFTEGKPGEGFSKDGVGEEDGKVLDTANTGS